MRVTFLILIAQLFDAMRRKDTQACVAFLDAAWAYSGLTRPERAQLHDLGNRVQALIFEQEGIA